MPNIITDSICGGCVGEAPKGFSPPPDAFDFLCLIAVTQDFLCGKIPKSRFRFEDILNPTDEAASKSIFNYVKISFAEKFKHITPD